MPNSWSIKDAHQTYALPHWSEGYFSINNDGNVVARVGDSGHEICLPEVIEAVKKEHMSLPVLLRFPHILQHRVNSLLSAFDNACASFNYQGRYTAVYPIKVNQQRTVVEHLLQAAPARTGLEAGSKPELMAVLAYAHPQSPIICNGYKDREYIRLALLAQYLGHRPYIVIEKLSETKLIIEECLQLGIRPQLGVRVRLSTMGTGKWQNTGGEKSKFGLLPIQVLELVSLLKNNQLLDCLQLLHCHLGSQIANIHDIQTGVREASRYVVELHRLGAPIKTVDIGGGLGIDYEGSRSRSVCSMNYSMQEYANTVVHVILEACDRDGIPHPDIVTESGRAMTAHHAVLVSNIIDCESIPLQEQLLAPPADAPLVIQDLWKCWQNLTSNSLVESYHTASHDMQEANTLYVHGVLSLEQRAQAEQLYYGICDTLRYKLKPQTRSHRELIDELSEKLADKYFLNASIFQSLPDVWAIDQIFPIMPLHRLLEKPDRRATLQDLTCDSDGAINLYVDEDSIESNMAVHKINNNEDYLIGIFLVGAYQEILGDMHNLFGDTHSVDVEINEKGQWHLSEAEFGDQVDDVLRIVHFDTDNLMLRYKQKLKTCKPDPEIEQHILDALQQGLTGYTYFEE